MLLRLGRQGLPGVDRPVAETFGAGSFTRAMVEPLTVAALNTPVAEASTRRYRHGSSAASPDRVLVASSSLAAASAPT